MKSYVVNCDVHAQDNDYLNVTEIRAAQQDVSELIAGIRALFGGQLETLLLSGEEQAVSFSAESGHFVFRIVKLRDVFPVAVSDLELVESFLLKRKFGIVKAGNSASLKLTADTGNEVSLRFQVKE